MFGLFKKKTKVDEHKIDDLPLGPNVNLFTHEKYLTIKTKYWVNSAEKEFDPSVWCFWKFGLKPPEKSGKWRHPTFTEALHRQYMWSSNYNFYVLCAEDGPCIFQKRTE